MKAGLFICDHVAAKHQAVHGDYTDMFAQLFPTFEWIHYDVTKGHFPENLEACDLYMATGSRHSVYENLVWIEQLKEVIRALYRQSKCFIGFCFGHQLLGEALGGQVAKSPQGWCVGVHQFEWLQKPEWMVNFPKPINMLMMCQDQVLVLPPEAQLLAGNEKCPHAIIQIGTTMLGIQGHPEFSKEYDQLLMETRAGKIGKQTVHQGIVSLKKEVNQTLIRQLILNFITQPSL